MKPEFLLINWSKGNVSACGTEKECREQLVKCACGDVNPRDTYLIAEVKVMSELKRVET